MHYCRVKDCKQNHIHHFCRNCGDNDSDHYSSACVMEKKKMSHNRCKVNGCEEVHEQHYCKVCCNNNSNHYASNCPFGITLYHGTTFDAAISIQKTGFRPSTGGCIGAGVYFTDSFPAASKIAQRWGGDAVVLECRLDNDNEFVAEGMHEPWYGTGHFKEFVVKEQYIKRIKIVKIHKV